MNQISFESFLKPQYVIDKPVRLIELFAGIGSQAKALERLGVDFEKYIISEWEVEAIRSYKAIHFNDDNADYSKDLNQKQLISVLYEMGISSDGKEPLTLQQVARHNEKWLRSTYNNIKATHNIVNVTNAKGSDLKIIDTNKFCYILTYSFPCQDLSLAGRQRGMSEGGQTRSSLLWEVKRLLYECKELPQVLLMENVTQVHSKKNADDFNRWIDALSDLGYSNYFADLNSKNYGVPQNRNRTFMISILGDYFYEFPEPFKLQKRLRDFLEDEVDEKYYLSKKGVEYITNPKRMNRKFTQINTNAALPLTASGNNNWTGTFIESDELINIGNINPSGKGIGSEVYGSFGIAPTLMAGHDNGKIVAIPNEEIIGSKQKNAYRGSLNGICPTLTAAMGKGGGQIPMIKKPIEAGDTIDINYPNSKTRKGRIQKQIAHTVGCQNNSQAVIVDDTFGFDEKPRIYKKIAPALRSERNGLKIIEEPFIVASRGRNSENPNDRRSGIPLKQRYEGKPDGTANCLTSVQKDNLVAVPVSAITDLQKQMITTDGKIKRYINSDIVEDFNGGQIADISFPNGYNKGPRVHNECPALTVTTAKHNFIYKEHRTYKLRKLTPKEALRLMTFTDADYEKIKAAGVVDTNIYKQAGNSIVVDVLVYIFASLFDKEYIKNE